MPFDFPILVRERRSRFRRDRAFLLLLVLLSGAAWICWRTLAPLAPTTGPNQWAARAGALWATFAWMKTLGVCLLVPGECAPLIAREREVGVGDELLLTPLSPLRVALEKWLAGSGFIALVLLVLWPIDLVAWLLCRGAPATWWPIALLQLGCLAWGGALGTLCSAHSRRASSATRSASGLSLLWLLGSFACALIAGEFPIWGRAITGFSPPIYVVWFGRTNPVLAALDLISPSPLEAKWPFCAAFLAVGTPLFLWLAARGLGKPLPELPLLSPRRTANGAGRGGVSGALARLELPLVGRFAPRNPVLGREVRGKFRLRQPPLPVLVSEIVLGVLVLGAYLLLVREALIDPLNRPVIFWGVAWAGMSIAFLSALTSGASALSRERENGTWDALRLSLLGPSPIVRGKVGASLATSVALSLPIWPLLLLCVDWSGSWTAISSASHVQPFQLVAGILIWLGTVWCQTTVAMLFGVRAKKAGSATGAATLCSLGWLLGSLFLLSSPGQDATGFLAVTNPLVALSLANDPQNRYLWAATGWPFAAFALVIGILALFLVEAELGSAFGAQAEVSG